jgi:hypothetical protein
MAFMKKVSLHGTVVADEAAKAGKSVESRPGGPCCFVLETSLSRRFPKGPWMKQEHGRRGRGGRE